MYWVIVPSVLLLVLICSITIETKFSANFFKITSQNLNPPMKAWFHNILTKNKMLNTTALFHNGRAFASYHFYIAHYVIMSVM